MNFLSGAEILCPLSILLRLILQRMYGHFPRTKLAIHIREVSLRRGSTVSRIPPQIELNFVSHDQNLPR